MPVRPVESDPRRPFAEFLRARQCRQRLRNRCEGTLIFIVRTLLLFDVFPAATNPARLPLLDIAEYVGMAPHQLVGNAACHLLKAEQTRLFSKLRVEHDLEQQIAEFTSKIGPVLAFDGVRHLVGLLDRVRRDRREVLLEVPGAARLPVPETLHDLK